MLYAVPFADDYVMAMVTLYSSFRLLDIRQLYCLLISACLVLMYEMCYHLLALELCYRNWHDTEIKKENSS